MSKPIKHWRVTAKEQNGDITHPELVGPYDIDDVRKFFGLDKPGAVLWYTIDEVKKGGKS